MPNNCNCETQFFNDMRDENPHIIDFEEAITFAMQCSHELLVPEYLSPIWFGSIGDGVFFATKDEWEWFPQTSKKKAIFFVTKKYGERIASHLTS